MIYAIPSYKRAEKQETLEFLRRMEVDPAQIYIFVQTKEDYVLYSERYSEECTIIFNVADSVSVARNNILNYFNGKDNLMMFDDDVSVFSVGSKNRKFIDVQSGDEFRNVVEKMFSTTYALHGYMFGLYPVYNEFFMSDDISTKVTVNTVLGFPKGFSLRFNDSWRAKEDIELCGRILSSGGRVIRFNNIAFKAKHRTNPGGAYDAWHSGINELLSRDLEMIYPDVFKVKSNNPNEVRVILKDEKKRGISWKKI